MQEQQPKITITQEPYTGQKLTDLSSFRKIPKVITLVVINRNEPPVEIPDDATDEQRGIKKIRLFDVLQWYRKEHIPEGCEIHCRQSNYDLLMLQLFSKPFKVKGLKVVSNTEEQLGEYMHLGYNSSFGVHLSQVYRPLDLIEGKEDERLVKTQTDDHGFEMSLNTDAFIEVPVLPGEQVTLIMYVEEELSLEKLDRTVAATIANLQMQIKDLQQLINTPKPTFWQRFKKWLYSSSTSKMDPVMDASVPDIGPSFGFGEAGSF